MPILLSVIAFNASSWFAEGSTPGSAGDVGPLVVVELGAGLVVEIREVAGGVDQCATIKPSIFVGLRNNASMRRWNNSAFETHVRALARETRTVRFTHHARTRMARRAITVPMVLECLRRGVIRRPPEQNIKTGWYECRMERYIAGKNVAVIAAVDEADPSVIVVTVIDLDA